MNLDMEFITLWTPGLKKQLFISNIHECECKCRQPAHTKTFWNTLLQGMNVKGYAFSYWLTQISQYSLVA